MDKRPITWAFGGFLALALVASGAGLANAQTMLNPDGSVSDQNNQTTGQTTTQTGTSTDAMNTENLTQPVVFTISDLTIGSTGQEVVLLQGFLSELGFLVMPIGVPMGYFGELTGELTADALARYQTSVGVPATGYFGPLTRIAVAAQFYQNGWIEFFVNSTSTSPNTSSGAMSSEVSWWYNSVDNTWNYTVTDYGTTTNDMQDQTIPSTVIDDTADNN
ncbi:MAG: peptidoglycan-binding domain-containing protein [bacterium]|nr:peptidoglycan-binding domain-containing protein [bacterium]